ncbi:hypothetical protein MCOR27_002143 [Pyricularia oryzae]|uniref:Rhodopsin domain-containing protein n=2 Tax=Pyricularia TaxID=48558 RepID=A0ABQ8N9X4_PYRGI|nr:hypothetical protein MCOR01_000005 [Pyricularia oryzae]KAI6293578.1 hypothetical protein MCOR33_009033 [Pyricularia grisea]KAH9428295.1 hypothetical protein MCOR02_011780 [Pyricularia oryzae]KAI6254561.1 hypothetical protein MCOR19_008924 [Pyricularia oryzae]KAI6271689.1 hypothetical protein MCOR26_007689 [Pyricularia oryzae]
MADSINHSLDHESRVGNIYASVIISLTAVTVVVLGRIYTRLFILKTFGLDDWAAAISLVFTLACGILVGVNAKYGCGRHIWTVGPAELQQFFINFYFSIVLYNVSILFTKASFLLQYYRVLATTRAMKQTYLAFLVIVVSACIAFTFVAIFACTPISDFWSFDSKKNCLPNFTIYYAQAGANIGTDIIIFALPLPALWKLRINGPQKLVLLGIFSLGFFATVISILRLTFLDDSPDITWSNAISSSWSTAEISIGLMCASLPSLRPLVGKVLPRLASTFGKSASPSKGAYGASGNRYGAKASQGGSRVPTFSTTATSSSRPQKTLSLYPDLEGSASVERLNSDDQATKFPGSPGTFLDDSSDRGGYPMTEFGTRTKVTAGDVPGHPVS